MAILTIFHKMIIRKFIPVAFLVLGEHPRAVAKGTHTAQGPNDCRTDELGSVGHVLDGLQELIIHLECDNALFFLHDLLPPVLVPQIVYYMVIQKYY